MQNSKFNRTGSFAPASANLLPSAEAQEPRGATAGLQQRLAALQPEPVQQIKVPACWEHAAKCVTVPLVLSVGKLLQECVVQQASTHKPLFFSLEIRFCVMNSQGFPCFPEQRNPGLTQQMMKGSHNTEHRQALLPEVPTSHLAVHEGRAL